MATDQPTHFVTPRDRELLRVLAWCPMTSEQLLKVSDTFGQPFTNYRYLQRRMQVLVSSGWARCFQYATASRGALNYYRLSPQGYRLLNGPDVPFPGKAAFNPVSPALQIHTRALTDFIVHTAVAAHREGIVFTNFHPENSLQLQLGEEIAKPDCAFQLLTSAGDHFDFIVELDAGTEPVVSTKERECVERKIVFYDRYRDATQKAFRLIVLTIHDSRREKHIIAATERSMRNPQRTLVYVGNLQTYLQQSTVRQPCFIDHRGRPQSLVPHYLPSPSFRTGTSPLALSKPLAPLVTVG